MCLVKCTITPVALNDAEKELKVVGEDSVKS